MADKKSTNSTKSTLMALFILFAILASIGVSTQTGLVFSGLVDDFSITGFIGAFILVINSFVLVLFSIAIANASERSKANKRTDEDEEILDILIDEIKKQTKNGPKIDWTGRY